MLKLEITIVPIHLYLTIYQCVLLAVILVAALGIYGKQLKFDVSPAALNWLGVFILVFTLIYIGFRPINGVFVDMTTYAKIFSDYEYGFERAANDPIFHYFTLLSSKLLNVNIYFLFCTLLYVVPLYISSKILLGRYWVYGFLFLIGSFSFWNYGTNGIRNGIASSLFILGLSARRIGPRLFWILVSVGFHKSMLIPALCFAATYLNKSPKAYIAFWASSILASFSFGNIFSNLILDIGFEDARVDYLSVAAETNEYVGGVFRWDFLIYSSVPVFLGYYYVVYKKYYDDLYVRLYCTYVLSNAFWILVIQANFSNRFAYLSWFIMGFILSYPLLTKNLIKNQGIFIAILLLIYFCFTYFMVIFS